jgi:protein SCO1/2
MALASPLSSNGIERHVSRSYRLGLQIVFGTVFVSAIVCSFAVMRASALLPRAAHDLGAAALPVGAFHFTERSGRTISDADLRGRVWVAAFIFTRCPLSCPRISTVMKGLQERLSKTEALLVSISVDPAHDTPAVLKAYADQFGAAPDRWWFLTGPKSATDELVQDRFKLAIMETSPAERADGAEAIAHSDRLALVDRGRVVGFFESTDPAALNDLIAKASRLAQPPWVRRLPSINASLNALCAVFLISGWVLIRRRQSSSPNSLTTTPRSSGRASVLSRPAVRGHVICMLLAVATSSVFLAFYLIYHFKAGSMPFPHGGSARWVYWTILLSHTLLATFGVVPLVVTTLVRAARGDYIRHLRIAQVTFPIWLYVSVTGVVIYLMLYQWPVMSTMTPPVIPTAL